MNVSPEGVSAFQAYGLTNTVGCVTLGAIGERVGTIGSAGQIL